MRHCVATCFWFSLRLICRVFFFPLRPTLPRPAQVPKLQRKIGSLTDETLFYIFYFMPGDVMQHAAAYILYERDWRYHKEHKFWMQRAGENQASQNQTYEQGSYYIFDVASWKRVSER